MNIHAQTQSRPRPDLRRIDTHPDYWYPVGWSHTLKRKALLGVRFAGEPIVLYRGASGRAFALEDRCAHRQVPLHLGVVEGESLRCGYHGWTYDCAGKCIEVPYLGREHYPNGVRSYPVHEVDGVIFVFPGNPELAQSRKPASLGSKPDRRYLTRRLRREVACHYSFMHENLFDMNHQFLHRRQMGMIRAQCLARRQGETWCEVDYTFRRTAGLPSVGETAILNAFGTRIRGVKRDLMTIRTEYPYQRLKVWVERRRTRARCLACLYAHGPRTAHQPHLRLSLGEEAADSRAAVSGLAVHHLVHGKYLPRRQGDRGKRAGGARCPGR